MSEKLANVRNISPVLQLLRNFLLGRKHSPARATLRYAEAIAARTQPPPNLPEGDAHKLSANHYCLRDGRREVEPPTVLAVNTSQKRVGPGSTAPPSKPKRITPGKYWEWD